MTDRLWEQIKRQEDVRAALSALREEIKEESKRRHVKELAGEGADLIPFLSWGDAKARKNAAALIGGLSIEHAAEAIYSAYQNEQTLFVRPVLLKALGQTDPYPYLQELREQYDLLCSREIREEEKKHIREEIRVLGQILRKEGEAARHTFTGWNQKAAVLLTARPAFAELLSGQIAAGRKQIHPLGVQAVTEDFREIIKIRTFRDLLFPIRLAEKVRYCDGPEALGNALADAKLVSLLERFHKEPAPFYFRFDLKGGVSLEERSRYLKRAAYVLEEKSARKLINAPEDYEYELRLILDKTENIHVFLKMFTIPMERFSYRKETVAASIHPSLAASLFALCRPYLKKNAQILDPCCGAGTMLVERHKILPAREIYGIDIFGEAVAKAKENVKAAGMHVNFINRDYLDFKHSCPFDEIIATLPIRGKRTKEEQDAFYRGFFDKSQELLALGGIMLLYSNENGFVKKQLRLHPAFGLRMEYPVSKQDSFYVYVIEKYK